jgi:hypothetical protein
MHWNCYASWKYQRRFANQYFESAIIWKSRNPHWPIVLQTQDLLITANPKIAVDIDLRAIGPGFRVSIPSWTRWITDGWRENCVHDLQRISMEAVQRAIHDALPDSDAVVTKAQQILTSHSK